MKLTKTKMILAIAGVVALAFAMTTISIWKSPEPQTISIEVTGTNGRAVEARIYADGSNRKFYGTIPAEFTVVAHRLSWEVKRLNGPEEEKFKVAVHIPTQENWGGFSESEQFVRGGSVGAAGLRRKRAWLGRLHE